MQGLVDFQHIFIDICVGWPGKIHDAHVLEALGISHQTTKQTLLPAPHLQMWPAHSKPRISA